MAEEKVSVVEETEEDTKPTESDSILDDTVAERLLGEIRDGYREWEFGDKKYRTRFPVPGEEAEARWAYARAFNKALAEGLPTQKEMRKTLSSRGIWSEVEEEKVKKLREEIGAIETILSKKAPKDRSKRVKDKVNELLEKRVEILDLTGTLTEYMNQTVEAISDEEKTAVLVAACTEDTEGTSVWEDSQAFLADKHGGLVSTATFQFVTFSNGVPEDYLGSLPEVKFLRAGREE